MKQSESTALSRPIISEFEDPVVYFEAALRFRKKTEPGFSVLNACKGLRRVSPTLISLIIKRKRKITIDRIDELAKLLNLNASEKYYLKNWIISLERGAPSQAPSKVHEAQRNRKEVATSILNDWINVYVKDFFQLPAIQKHPQSIHDQLMHVASGERVKKSISFLLREGYLRKNLKGEIVIDVNLAVADPKVPSVKIRNFHKGALKLAKLALDLYPPSERIANTLIMPLNEKKYSELVELFQEFAEKLKDFAADSDEPADRLYQLIFNLSPVGGKL